MIEKFKTEYLDDIMQIWLASNISAHSFIKSSYWKSMFDEVKKNDNAVGNICLPR